MLARFLLAALQFPFQVSDGCPDSCGGGGPGGSKGGYAF